MRTPRVNQAGLRHTGTLPYWPSRRLGTVTAHAPNEGHAQMARPSRWFAPLVTLAGVVLAVGVPTATATANAAAKPSAGRGLQRSLDRLVAAGAPGAVALVREHGRTIRLASGYADTRTKRSMRPSDRFRVGSVTKTFVATVILQLAGEGKLSLDDSVERWLPGEVPNGGAITVRQLLTMTSGIFDYLNDGDDTVLERELAHPDVRWAPQDLVAIATTHAPRFAPGTAWSYSNTGYILLGQIAEKAAGKPIADSLRERIFTPAGLHATSFETGPGSRGPAGHEVGDRPADRRPARPRPRRPRQQDRACRQRD